MTVKELIEQLRTVNPDAVVLCGEAEVTRVSVGLGAKNPDGEWYGNGFGVGGFGPTETAVVARLE